MASSRDLSCQTEAATSSLASVKGPSTTVRDLPENLTRAPLERAEGRPWRGRHLP